MTIPVNFLVNHVGASQMMFYLIEQANEINKQGSLHASLFYSDLHRPCRQLELPTFLMIEAWAQPGVSISTSIPTTLSLLRFPGPNVRMFYVWDMSWMDNPKRYGVMTSLFRHPSLHIIARCNHHAQIISNNFNIEVKHIVENFQHQNLSEVIHHEYSLLKK
jgi:hypothetical protein